MQIKNIKHYPEFEETVATWLFNEWGLKGSEEYWKEWVKFSQDETSTFQTFVVVEKDKLLATYGLMPCDLQSRQDLFPWIGNLFIPKEHRLKSISILIAIHKHSEKIFRKLKLKTVYVYTPHNPLLFKRFGYKYFGKTIDLDGTKISLLKKEIEY